MGNRRPHPELRDEAADHGDSIGDERDRAGRQRDQVGYRRDQAGSKRDRAGDQRDQAGDRRDRTANQRDKLADERDRIADERDQAGERAEAGSGWTSTGAVGKSVQARHEAASDRRHAWQDRRAGASERTRAELDRGTAQVDRSASAHDRNQAGSDRDTALRDRGESARERRDSSLDALTGAYLRGPGLELLSQDIERARRHRQPLILVFIDVDHLKAINDASGHTAGDEMLADVAGAFRARLRSYDLLMRYGGDEFLCAIADVTLEIARERVAVIKETLARRSPLGSVTVGFAELQPSDSLEDLITRADAEFYRVRDRDRRANL